MPIYIEPNNYIVFVCILCINISTCVCSDDNGRSVEPNRTELTTPTQDTLLEDGQHPNTHTTHCWSSLIVRRMKIVCRNKFGSNSWVWMCVCGIVLYAFNSSYGSKLAYSSVTWTINTVWTYGTALERKEKEMHVRWRTERTLSRVGLA